MQFGPGALAAAFAAGFVSFVSPCVLPLIPGYLSFVSGVGFDELGAQPRQVTRATALFVLGFAAMFVAFGAGAAWFGGALLENRRTLELAAGIFIALAGLVYAGVPLPRLLLAERRLQQPSRGGGVVTPTLAGVAFAVGWTPCVGPTLAAILALAAGEGHPAQGAVLLAGDGRAGAADHPAGALHRDLDLARAARSISGDDDGPSRHARSQS